MQNISTQGDWQALRSKLVTLIETSNTDLDGQVDDSTSLIKSGRLDSLGLFNVALFIEREIGRNVDMTSFNLATEWDTVNDILNFIQKLRGAQ